MSMELIVREIRLSPDVSEREACRIAEERVRTAFGSLKVISSGVFRRSVDARGDVKFNYSVSVICEGEADVKGAANISALEKSKPEFRISGPKAERGIAVIGFGPAGMFSALALSKQGYKVTVYERGSSVEQRKRDVYAFTSGRTLNTDSNIQFGAGGAGTFSDGKLVTRINDPICSHVLETFVSYGAPEEILKAAKPHIGTDKLCAIVENIASDIVKHGGTIRYNTRVDDVYTKNGHPVVVTEDGELCYDAVILATGHSARDTYLMLTRRGYAMEQKPFSVGVRIEHLQEDINRSLYSRSYDKYRELLPKAEYQLSHRCVIGGIERGVYTFCMCPGGTVAAAASEENTVVTNGMSEYKRDGVNANSAVAVSVYPSDTGSGLLDGVEFQRRLEKAAFLSGGSDYSAPVETVGHLYGEYGKDRFAKVMPTYPIGTRFAKCSDMLPGFVTEMLKIGIRSFDKKLKRFSAPDSVLTFPETRTSAPLRVLRGDDGQSLSHKMIFPCGEGAGYAGGITSAAVDGIRCAMKIMEKVSPI